jgi:hypothetical protein
MTNIKEILEKEGPMLKLSNVAPEGFVLVHEKTLEDLKDFDNWKAWKNKEISLYDLDKRDISE